MVMFALLPVVIAQNIYQPRAIDSRMQIASGVYFDPTTGITSVILTNTELIGPNKVKEIDDLPLIVVNIPPVLNETGHEAIVKEAQSIESWVIKEIIDSHTCNLLHSPFPTELATTPYITTFLRKQGFKVLTPN